MFCLKIPSKYISILQFIFLEQKYYKEILTYKILTIIHEGVYEVKVYEVYEVSVGVVSEGNDEVTEIL